MRRAGLRILLVIGLLLAGCQPAPGATTAPSEAPSSDAANPDGFY